LEGRQIRLLLILAAALAAMVLALVLLDAPEAPEEEGVADRLDLPVTEIARFHLITATDAVTAERSEDGWWLVEPLQARADDRMVEGLLGAFDRLQTGEPFEGVDPADFGLDSPAAKLTVTLNDGTEHTLVVGAEAPVGMKTYVDVDGGGVRAASGRVADSLILTANDLRDNRVHTFAASAVTALRWEAEGEGWAVTREGDGWRLADGRRAAASTLEGHLAGLGALTLSGFLSDQAASVRGLDAPLGRLVILSGDEPEAVIEVGREAADGVALRTPAGATGLLDSLDALRPYLASLLEARLLPVDVSSVTAVTIALGDREARYVASGGGAWSRDGAAVSDTTAGRLNQLLAVGTADRAAMPERGTGAGRLVVEASETLTVTLGADTGDGRAAWEDEGPAFVIPDATVSLLTALLDG